MQTLPSPGYSLIIRARYQNQVGMLGRITSEIGSQGGDITAIDIVEAGGGFVTRDITINVRDSSHGQACVDAVRQIPNLRIINVSDRVFLLHLGGKLDVTPRVPVRTRDDMMMVYMPGVARVVRAIQEEPDKVFTLTIKRNTIAVVTDGSAVVGLGNVGPEAALPVMEGKALLIKEFADVDAFPICLSTQDPDEVAAAVRAIAPVFGAIDLEGMAEPRCFGVERRLQRELDIPVFHGSRYGTAAVVLAALINSCRLLKREMGEMKVVLSGSGPASVVCAHLLLAAGVRHLVVSDPDGNIVGEDPSLEGDQRWLAEHTNREHLEGRVQQALEGADVFVGVSGSHGISADEVRAMAPDPLIFELATDEAVIMPEELLDVARVIATGRPDFPNHINNVLCVPGLFRGLLDSRCRGFAEPMALAAARTIADLVGPQELHEEYIIPSVFDKRVVPAVARAVSAEAESAGLSRRPERPAG